MLNNVVLRV